MINLFFLHAPRTGGSTIETILGRVFKNPPYKDTITFDCPLHIRWGKDKSMPPHPTVALLSKKGVDLTKYVVFTSVRNPWQMVLSLYFHNLHNNLIDSTKSFRQFILEKKRWPAINLCIEYSLVSKYVLRFETLNRDFMSMFVDLGLPPITLSEKINSMSYDKENWRQYYDAECISIIGNTFKSHIEKWGYICG